MEILFLILCVLLCPASSHKGSELSEREKKITDRLTEGQMGGQRNKDRGNKRARDFQGEKVIPSDIQPFLPKHLLCLVSDDLPQIEV